jgi:Na+/melibiose symporter-like transporter
MPTIYFNNEVTNFKEVFQQYVLTGAIITLCCCIPALLFMRTRPRVPPSISSQKFNEIINHGDLIENMKSLFNNKSFICMLISYSAINGYYFIYFVTANNYYSIYDIDQTTVSYLLCISNICGLICSILFSLVIDNIRHYKKIFVTLNSFLLVVFIFMTIYFETIYTKDNIIILYICFGLFGTCLIPLYSIALDFVSEITYPIGESFSIGTIRSTAHIVGFISTYIIQILLEHLTEYKYLPHIYSISLFVISLIALGVLKGIST